MAVGLSRLTVHRRRGPRRRRCSAFPATAPNPISRLRRRNFGNRRHRFGAADNNCTLPGSNPPAISIDDRNPHPEHYPARSTKHSAHPSVQPPPQASVRSPLNLGKNAQENYRFGRFDDRPYLPRLQVAVASSSRLALFRSHAFPPVPHLSFPCAPVLARASYTRSGGIPGFSTLTRAP